MFLFNQYCISYQSFNLVGICIVFKASLLLHTPSFSEKIIYWRYKVFIPAMTSNQCCLDEVQISQLFTIRVLDNITDCMQKCCSLLFKVIFL